MEMLIHMHRHLSVLIGMLLEKMDGITNQTNAVATRDTALVFTPNLI